VTAPVGKVYVTGGASGIGLMVAQLFAERGADVAIFDLHPTPEALQAIEAKRRGPGQQVRSYLLDVADADGALAVFRAAAADFGAPDLVFNSAGVGGFTRPFEDYPRDRFEAMVRVNLLGSRNVAAAVLPLMRPGGKLVLVASLAGLVTAYGYAGYAASKHGVVGLAGVLRVEYKPKGIDVSVVCPPEIDTPMVRQERPTRPPESHAMKMVAGIVDLDVGCRYIVERALRGQFLIIPGARARFTWLMQKVLPRSVINAMADRMVTRVRARIARARPS
jgi:NAD(P)-dependent dehydrogenase (short-subunit alcohol dehydrogenase family)